LPGFIYIISVLRKNLAAATMKKSIIISLAIVIAGTLFFSCSKSPEKKIAGTWKVEDVKFSSTREMSPAQQQALEASKQSAKEVKYELLEDHSAKILVGKTVLEGTWTYKAAEAGVYMAFKGSADTILIGKIEEDKLINIANRPELVITTIFTKDE